MTFRVSPSSGVTSSASPGRRGASLVFHRVTPVFVKSDCKDPKLASFAVSKLKRQNQWNSGNASGNLDVNIVNPKSAP